MSATFLLDPDVPDLAALGALGPEDLIGVGEPLFGESDAEQVDERTWRVPLPGTLRGRPRGAGTGWVRVRRFDGGTFLGRWRARLTHPRSDSLAAREWNLLCALRSAGVVTAAPMAIAAEAHPYFAKRSAIVTRDLEKVKPLAECEGMEGLEEARELLVKRLEAAGIRLDLADAQLAVLTDGHAHQGETAEDACGLEKILAARKRAPEIGEGLSWRNLPELVVTEVTGARLG